MIAAGIYLAAEPQSYRSGFLLLLPKSVRGTVGVALEKAAAALRLWLLGQFIAMILVGVLTTAGLYLIGVRSALALGLFSALAEFIPIVGPVVSGVAAVLVALSQGGDTVLWVIALFIVVQQIEGNVVMPIVQRRTVELPPVLQIFALVVFGILFHLPGIVLGTPLAVVAYVAVKQLYVRDLLHEPVHVPGDHIGRS